jgi:hypothetical protein
MLAPSNTNLLFGKGRVHFRRTGSSGFLDLGEVPKFDIEPKVETDRKYSSRSGTNTLLLEWEKTREVNASLELMEYNIDNLNLAFMGDGVQAGAQAAGQIDELAVTMVPDLFVDIGSSLRHAITYKKITHGAVTGDTFSLGETVTGGTSTKTAKVVRVGDGFIECINDTGLQANEVITGGTSTASATVSGIETMKGAIVMPSTQFGARTAVGTPTGTNEPTVSGCFWDDADIDLHVKISTAGTPDKFKYSLDGGLSWSAEIDCATAATYLAKGISITWSATTGGVLNDEWKWTVTARYQSGTDYDVEPGAGMIRKRSTGGIGASAVVSCDYPAKTLKSVRALAGARIEGELRFVGDPDQGQKFFVQGWDVLLTVGGAAAFIGDDVTPIPMNASFQKDESNHPTEPFFRATEIA